MGRSSTRSALPGTPRRAPCAHACALRVRVALSADVSILLGCAPGPHLHPCDCADCSAGVVTAAARCQLCALRSRSAGACAQAAAPQLCDARSRRFSRVASPCFVASVLGRGLSSACHEHCSAASAHAPRASMQPAIFACGRRLASAPCVAIVERHLQQRSAAGAVICVTRQVPDPTRMVSCADLHAHVSLCAPPPSSPQGGLRTVSSALRHRSARGLCHCSFAKPAHAVRRA